MTDAPPPPYAPEVPDTLDSIALFLDVDGTLLEIAPAPHLVVVPPEFPALLEALRRRLGGALAVISGRPLEQLDRLFRPTILAGAGLHGAELRRGGDSPLCRLAKPVDSRLRDAVAALCRRHPGALAEDKGSMIAIHYRAAPDAESALRQGLQEALAASAAPLRLLEGRMVFELKPPHIDKGVALRTLMEQRPFAGRRPLFVGDDVTDRDGWAAARLAGGWGFKVGDAVPDEPMAGPPAFQTPAEVRSWLARLLDR